MNFVNYFNTIKSKNASDLRVRELSLLVREKSLNKILRTE